MGKRVLSRGPHKLVLFDYDEVSDSIIIERQYWVDPVLQMTKEQRDSCMRSTKDELRPLANIPMFEIAKAMQQGSLHDKKYWKKWMNDSDNRDFRITDGKA